MVNVIIHLSNFISVHSNANKVGVADIASDSVLKLVINVHKIGKKIIELTVHAAMV